MTFILPDMATIGDALHKGSARLRDAGVGSGNVEAAILLSRATGLDRLGLINHVARPLSPKELAEFAVLINRRMQHEPIQYITGQTEFMGLAFEVDPSVLVPRPDTEILVEAVLDLEEEAGAREGVVIADLGTGSGAIAVSIASFLQYVEVVAVDVSDEALEVAQRNVERHGVSDRVRLVLGDGLEALEPWAGKFSYLVSNPPYISAEEVETLDAEVKDYEPHLALTPGEDALYWYRRFAQEGAAYLRPDGVLAVEVGHTQAAEVVDLLRRAGWREVTTRQDLQGIERVVVARRPAA